MLRWIFNIIIMLQSIMCYYLGTRMSVIGLTGGIACGKSTVVQMFKELSSGDIKVIDCDSIVHKMYEDSAFIQKIFETFGRAEVASADGKSVDRTKLGEIVFKDHAKRRQLGKLINTPIFITILKRIFRLRFIEKAEYVVLDAPLLFESKVLEYFCFPIIVVAIADKEL